MRLLAGIAIAALARWGLKDRLVATGCPPIDTYFFDFGPVQIEGAPGTGDSPVAYCPRRTVLDKLLVDAAVQAGAEVREGFTVEELVIENGRVIGIRGRSKRGRTVTEHADLEEQFFYPTVRDITGEDQLVEEADIEHASVRQLIDELRGGKAEGARGRALFTVLMEYVRHHIQEEEERIFPLVKKTGIDLEAFGEELADDA